MEYDAYEIRVGVNGLILVFKQYPKMSGRSGPDLNGCHYQIEVADKSRPMFESHFRLFEGTDCHHQCMAFLTEEFNQRFIQPGKPKPVE